MSHDDGRDQCFCRDWHGCIMAQSIVGLENVQPYKFSDCSKNDYINELRVGQGLCLLNKPNEVGNFLMRLSNGMNWDIIIKILNRTWTGTKVIQTQKAHFVRQ